MAIYIKITGLVDKGRTMNAAYLDFRRDFSATLHNILVFE